MKKLRCFLVLLVLPVVLAGCPWSAGGDYPATHLPDFENVEGVAGPYVDQWVNAINTPQPMMDDLGLWDGVSAQDCLDQMEDALEGLQGIDSSLARVDYQPPAMEIVVEEVEELIEAVNDVYQMLIPLSTSGSTTIRRQ